MKWIRVTRANRCPYCGKPDWCCISEKWILCMRVESDKPSKGGSGGWLHPAHSGPAPRPFLHPAPGNTMPPLNVAAKLKEWLAIKWEQDLGLLSERLGVSVSSLSALGCCRAIYRNTWAFPMKSGDGHYCGIRLRNLDGKKWAERGSHQGLFMGAITPRSTVLICEGPTDCAAALTLGLEAIGRPSCLGGVDHIKVALRRVQARRAVIVADLDDPGLRGAKTLQEHLPIPSAILTCPAKDLRSAIQAGMNREMLDAMVSQLIFHNPRYADPLHP